MATIVIRDLPESVELDRKAMLAISGGARNRTRLGLPLRAESANRKILDLLPRRTPVGTPSR